LRTCGVSLREIKNVCKVHTRKGRGRNQDQDQEIGADQAQSAVELANNINSFCGQDERVKTVYKIIYDNLFSQACVTTLRNLNDFWVQQIALTLSSPPNNCSAGRPGTPSGWVVLTVCNQNLNF